MNVIDSDKEAQDLVSSHGDPIEDIIIMLKIAKYYTSNNVSIANEKQIEDYLKNAWHNIIPYYREGIVRKK